MDGSQQGDNRGNNADQHSQSIPRTADQGIIYIHPPKCAINGNCGDDKGDRQVKKPVQNYSLQTLEKILAARMPTMTEIHEDSQVAGRMSKGVEQPAPARTAATVVGMS